MRHSRKNGNEDKDDDHTTKKWGEGLPPFFHEEDDYELEAELRAIATEYYQQEAIAKVFAVAAKVQKPPPGASRDMPRGTRTRRPASSSPRWKRFCGNTGRNCR